MTLPIPVQNTINTLEEFGFEAYAVGGAVRDFLLGKTAEDWDIATSAPPNDVIKIFGEKNCIPTGIKHGTVTLVNSGQIIEITTYRIDGEYLDHRRPEKVEFAKSICDDLSRRDFTVNAMAFNPGSGFVDPFDGQSDLTAKIIRAVGEPSKRFSEDALRIIRGLRFAANLGFVIEDSTQSAIHQYKHLLNNIAKERLQSEFSKLVMADNPEEVLIQYPDVFAEFFGINNSFSQAKWENNAKKLHLCSHILPLRLAVLLKNISPDAAPHNILRMLKYDNKTTQLVKVISNYMDCEIAPDPICIKHILSDLGEDTFRLVLQAKKVNCTKKISTIYNIEEILNKIIQTNQCYNQKNLAIDGYDLMELGIRGKDIGRVLKLLLNEVIENRCENEKKALIQFAKKML